MSDAWPARPEEGSEVTRLLIAFRDWLGAKTPDDAAFAASVARLYEDRATEFLLGRVVSDDPPCGVCQLRFRHSIWTSAPDCWLEDLYVEDAARGRGVGRALVVLAMERASARGARRIELDTNERNHGAIALYESLGFSSASKVHGRMRGRDLFMGRRLP
ncbi:MAG: GNAT family N-acetyltransferase [Solirubrobacteraceae bacterium]